MQKQLIIVVVIQLLLQLQIVLNCVHGNSSTATTAESAKVCTGNSATATRLQTARNINLNGAIRGNANFDGSGNITINTIQNNIFELSGSVNLLASDGNTAKQTIWELAFPSGLNKDNCVCIAFGVSLYTKDISGFGYGTGFNDAGGQYYSDIPRSILVGNVNNTNSIVCQALNILTTNRTLRYKIVLMKTS